MAEQVYGFKLRGTTTLSSMMVKNDQLRIDVDAVVRGAELASVRPIADDVYEVILEMSVPLSTEIEDRFCISPSG